MKWGLLKVAPTSSFIEGGGEEMGHYCEQHAYSRPHGDKSPSDRYYHRRYLPSPAQIPKPASASGLWTYLFSIG
jgi:hypothetical protein